MSKFKPYIDTQHVNFYKFSVKVIFSLVILVGGTYVACSSTIDDSTKKAAIGFIGAVIGYWIK